MSKSKAFRLTFEYNVEGSEIMLAEFDYAYTTKKSTGNIKVYSDHVLITTRDITITGDRSKKSSIENWYKNTSNIIYKEILISLNYAYLTQGCAFNFGECDAVYAEENILITTGKIVNVFTLSFSEIFRLPAEACFSLICANTPSSRQMLVALSEYAIALNCDSPDPEIQLFEYWKSLNTVYAYLYMKSNPTGRSTEHRQIACLSKYIKDIFTAELNSVAQAAMLAEKILAFQVKSCLLNMKKSDKSTEKQLKYIKEEVLVRTDKRLLEVYSDIINGDTKHFPFTESSKDAINDYIRTITEEDNTDLLCFATLTYGYWLRCKHFHGEKSTPRFLSSEIPENVDIGIVIKLLRYMLIDSFVEISKSEVKE